MARRLLAALLLLAVAAGGEQCGPRRPRPLVLPPDPRVLVFAPHPDDETIALGGLLFRLGQTHMPVRIVFLTSGDGYLEAAQAHFQTSQPSAAQYLALGRLRQDEARAAARRLGLDPAVLRFLGFPDDGLADLWGPFWSRPYTSPHTGARRPPYPDDVSPETDFEGRHLAALIERQLIEFAPTVVMLPHPADSHTDHAHTSYFVIAAVRELVARGALPADLPLLTYLVHYPSWPRRLSSDPDRQLPLTDLPDTVWEDSELSAAALDAKRAAVTEYRSQLAVMQGFLQSFLSRNELLARVDDAVLARIASVH